MPKVSVISADWTLRVTVRAELLQEGFEALGMDSVADLAQAVTQGAIPSAIVLDAALVTPETAGPLSGLARRVPTVVVASRPEVAGEPGAHLEGAAVVLYRPVRVGEIVSRVKQLLAGHVA